MACVFVMTETPGNPGAPWKPKKKRPGTPAKMVIANAKACVEMAFRRHSGIHMGIMNVKTQRFTHHRSVAADANMPMLYGDCSACENTCL